MSECNNDCASCGQNCSSRTAPQDFSVHTNDNSNVKKVIGVVSGKGGVGKSLVTSLLAVASARKGYKTAILDADITGPSIPQGFGIHGTLFADYQHQIIPAVSKTGIEMVSTNLIIDDEGSPVIWRGSLIASMVKQFFTDTNWGEVDYMFVDMPPGTGDVPLTVYQSLPLDGIVVVTTPQDLVSMIVEKAVRMAAQMNVPVIGIVENMSYVVCDNCGTKVSLFGNGGENKLASKFGLKVLAKLPLDPSINQFVDKGEVEAVYLPQFEEIMDYLTK